MSEVFSYSIDAVVEPIQYSAPQRSGLVDAIGQGVLLTGRALGLLDELAASAERSLSSIAAQDRELVQATRTIARASALRSDPRLAALAAAVNLEMPGGVESFASLARLSGMPALEASAQAAFAGVAGRQFEKAIVAGSQRKLAEEQTMLLDAVQGAMRDIGYEPSVPRPKGRDLIVTGRNGSGQALVVQLDPGHGRLVGDLAGHGGTACTLDGKKFEDRLRARGLEVRRTEGRIHGDPGGGQLARQTLAQPSERAAVPERLRQGPSHTTGREPHRNA